MTSDRQIAANRRNAGRSTGPRTGAGKQTVARNALRHGLAATAHHSPALADELDRLANALGDEHADAAQREQALIIAESELALLRVRAARTTLFERMLASAETESLRESSEQPDAPRQRGPGETSPVDQLSWLERYERRSLSRRQRAI